MEDNVITLPEHIKIGKEVFVMHYNKIHKTKIDKITTVTTRNKLRTDNLKTIVTIDLTIKGDDVETSFDLSKVFKTKEDLVQSLYKELTK